MEVANTLAYYDKATIIDINFLTTQALGQDAGLTHEKILGWKGLPGTYTLAYSAHLKIKAILSFIKLAPRSVFTTLHCLRNK